MSYILGALVVYKLVQLIDSLTPKEAMPWVKIVFGIILGYGVSFVVHTPNVFVGGCVIATLAGILHALLRLVIVLGDMAQRKVIR